MVLAACALAGPVGAGTTDYTVTKTADTNDGTCNSDCSLREAIVRANTTSADSIFVPEGVYRLTLVGDDDLGAVGDLDVRKSMAIVGDGARSTIIDGNGIDRVFDMPHQGISTPFFLGIFNVKITGGRSGGSGGGIAHNAVDATLNVTASTVSGNRAQYGAGIFAQQGPASVTRSTISGNRATDGNGGGVYNGGSTLAVNNSTISGNEARFGGGIMNYTDTDIADSTIAFNRAEQPGGGVFINSGTVDVKNTILSNNRSDSGSAFKNCSSAVNSLGHNIEKGTSCGFDELTDVNADPKIDELDSNGGPTKTHRLRAASPAIDNGGFPFPATDQRGVVRPQGPAPDIGSYERFFNG